MRSIVFFILTTLLVSTSLHSGDTSRVEATVRFLADDRLEGRATPGRGLEVAARYLAEELRAAGWKPLSGDDYFQRYDLLSYRAAEMEADVEIAGVSLKQDEFVLGPLAIQPGIPIESDLVFVGHGIDEPARSHRDYEGVNVDGKGVVVVPGAPWRLTSSPYGSDRVVGKVVSSRNRGAAITVIVVPKIGSDVKGDLDLGFAAGLGRSTVALLPALKGRPASGLGPILAISEAAWDRVLAARAGSKFAAVKRRPDSLRGRELGKITVRVRAETTASRPANIVAILPGTDPLLAKEYVVLTAHYDHVGMSNATDAKDRIYNGADDNASGTAAILEVARRLAASPHQRSVVVLLDSGEEKGLLGSAYFAHHAPIDLQQVVANFNVDMVGRSNGQVQAITNGSDDLFAVIKKAGEPLGLEVVGDQQPEWRVLNLSDDYQFARRGVPSVEFFTGFHGDYHGVGDEADKINYANLAKITDLLERAITRYADGEAKPRVVWPEWFPLDTSAR